MLNRMHGLVFSPFPALLPTRAPASLKKEPKHSDWLDKKKGGGFDPPPSKWTSSPTSTSAFKRRFYLSETQPALSIAALATLTSDKGEFLLGFGFYHIGDRIHRHTVNPNLVMQMRTG